MNSLQNPQSGGLGCLAFYNRFCLYGGAIAGLLGGIGLLVHGQPY